jgi:hypothetical protein
MLTVCISSVQDFFFCVLMSMTSYWGVVTKFYAMYVAARKVI